MDVLVNCAGIGIGGSFATLETKKIDLQLDVNLRATLIVTREALPLLRASSGFIITLASIAGTIPVPGLSVYAATKAALDLLDELAEPRGGRAWRPRDCDSARRSSRRR